MSYPTGSKSSFWNSEHPSPPVDMLFTSDVHPAISSRRFPPTHNLCSECYGRRNISCGRCQRLGFLIRMTMMYHQVKRMRQRSQKPKARRKVRARKRSTR